MKKELLLMAFAATTILTVTSCGSTRSGAGGYSTNMGVDARGTNLRTRQEIDVNVRH